jgi:hypothetical protein
MGLKMSDLETRLLEFWKADAQEWRRLTRKVWEASDREPTKIDIAKRRSLDNKNVRNKQASIAAGKRVHKIKGTMRLAERPDTLRAPVFKCVVCRNPFSAAPRVRRAPLYCSRACNMAAFRAREAARDVNDCLIDADSTV